MTPVDPSTGWNMVKFLGKKRHLFKPGGLEFAEKEVLISGEFASIRYEARVVGNWPLHFEPEAAIDIFLPAEIGFAGDVLCETRPVRARAIRVRLGDILALAPNKPRRDTMFNVEVHVPCVPRSFLAFRNGEDGKRERHGTGMTTRFVIAKRHECRRFIIRDYLWRRDLASLKPLSALSVMKNGEIVACMTDVVTTTRLSISAAEVCVAIAQARGELPPGQHHTGVSEELVVPMSFDSPNDEYTIIITGSGGGA
jgi:hypothetical protein